MPHGMERLKHVLRRSNLGIRTSMKEDTDRRTFQRSTGAALTTAVFTGDLRGANDRIAAAFIGTGRMGMSNLDYAMKQPGLEVTAVCDVCQPWLDEAYVLARPLACLHDGGGVQGRRRRL